MSLLPLGFWRLRRKCYSLMIIRLFSENIKVQTPYYSLENFLTGKDLLMKIVKLSKGSLKNIIIPGGNLRWGWRKMADCLDNLVEKRFWRSKGGNREVCIRPCLSKGGGRTYRSLLRRPVLTISLQNQHAIVDRRWDPQQSFIKRV